MIFLAASKVKAFSKNKMLEKAFIGIVEALGQRNFLLTILEDDVEDIKDTASTAFARLPHLIASTSKSKFLLNSSALVLTESVKKLQLLNNRTTLHEAFHQLVIFCSDGTYEKISEIPTQRVTKAIV